MKNEKNGCEWTIKIPVVHSFFCFRGPYIKKSDFYYNHVC